MARPCKYDSDIHDSYAAFLSKKGLTDVDIAKKLKIAVSTLNRWKKKYPSFWESLKSGKYIADAKVQESLYKRALGYTITEEKEIKVIDKEGKERVVRTEIVEKQIAPDTTAQIFWLKNRQPASWRDKQEVDVTINPFLELMKKAGIEEED